MEAATVTHDPETGEVLDAPPAAPAPLALVQPSGQLAAIKARAINMRAFLEEEREIRELVKAFVKEAMVEGDDYGKIPGTDKPTLLKPGAEKLVALFNVEPVPVVAHRVEDWDKGLFHYEVHVQLRERGTGIVRAVGMGSANSREGRYRWRNSERVCPRCGKPNIIKGKEEYGGGWLCFAKKGGCGEKFPDDAPEITSQVTGKVENDDIATLVNTILKMAKKRALVDGSIALARCSDIFTQDVEDFADQVANEPKAPAQRDQQRPAQQRSSSGGTSAPRPVVMPYGNHKGKPVTDKSITVRDLEWMRDAMAKALVDQSKQRYAPQNQALYDACKAEIARRHDANPAPDDCDDDGNSYDRDAPQLGDDDIPF